MRCLEAKKIFLTLSLYLFDSFLPTVYTGHKGFTDSLEAFYIYLDTTDTMVASGSEDCRAR